MAPTLSVGAQDAIRRGNKIEAIKLIREELNVGLKEAKDMVEAFIAADPSLKTQYDAKTITVKRGPVLIFVGALAALLYLLLSRS